MIGFSEEEEAFFRVADTSTFEYLDDVEPTRGARPSLLRRLLSFAG